MTTGNNSIRILVMGAGVSGLTTAIELRRAGFEVTIAAEKFAPQIVSVVAGALWEWPPAVCGYHQDPVSLRRARLWSIAGYRAFEALAKRPETGVFMRPAVFYFRQPLERLPKEREKMEELREHVQGFRHSPELIQENGVDPATGVQDAYCYLAPMIDTDAYMTWLLAEVRAAGCDIRQATIQGPLLEQQDQLLRSFEADLIVNCTGLGAIGLGDANMFPLRGAVVRADNRGAAGPRIDKAHCVSFSGEGGRQDMVFILPRGERMLLLGGLVEPHQWDTNIGLANYPPVAAMLERCRRFLPALRDIAIDAAEPVRAGLRPFRPAGIRLEHDAGTRIVHNYGHGGSGVTLSWGCAGEVVELARREFSR